MSSSGISGTEFGSFPLRKTGTDSPQGVIGKGSAGTTSSNSDFSSSLVLRMATLQAQSVKLLIGSADESDSMAPGLDFLLGINNTAPHSADLLSQIGMTSATTPGSSASGRNPSLFDPESGYNMMSVINSKDVTYKAQFSELSKMKDAVAEMQRAGSGLSHVSEVLDNETITSRIQNFVGTYNDWIKRFDDTVKRGGVLEGTQAAEVSLYEFEQSVENPFNGASYGFHGLSDLGITIDENTNLASLDINKLQAALATNRSGTVDTINEFGANFAKSAELLNSTGNFIPNRLANLDRVIDYIENNRSALQTEFGLGAPAKMTEQLAQALASYRQIAAI